MENGNRCLPRPLLTMLARAKKGFSKMAKNEKKTNDDVQAAAQTTTAAVKTAETAEAKTAETAEAQAAENKTDQSAEAQAAESKEHDKVGCGKANCRICNLINDIRKGVIKSEEEFSKRFDETFEGKVVPKISLKEAQELLEKLESLRSMLKGGGSPSEMPGLGGDPLEMLELLGSLRNILERGDSPFRMHGLGGNPFEMLGLEDPFGIPGMRGDSFSIPGIGIGGPGMIGIGIMRNPPSRTCPCSDCQKHFRIEDDESCVETEYPGDGEEPRAVYLPKHHRKVGKLIASRKELEEIEEAHKLDLEIWEKFLKGEYTNEDDRNLSAGTLEWTRKKVGPTIKSLRTGDEEAQTIFVEIDNFKDISECVCGNMSYENETFNALLDELKASTPPKADTKDIEAEIAKIIDLLPPNLKGATEPLRIVLPLEEAGYAFLAQIADEEKQKK